MIKTGEVFYSWVHKCYYANYSDSLSVSKSFNNKQDAIDYLLSNGVDYNSIIFDLKSEELIPPKDTTEEKVRYNYTTDKDRMIKIKQVAAENGLKINSFIDAVIDEYFKFNSDS